MNVGDVESADFIFANPPCSRFSTTATGTFSAAEKSDVRNFADFKEIFESATRADARLVWWETGPLAWSQGRALILTISEELERLWGEEVTTIIVKIDPRYAGVPQKRPRTHLLHFRGRVVPPDRVENSRWPAVMDIGIGPWLDSELKRWKCTTRTPLLHPWNKGDGAHLKPTYILTTENMVSDFSMRKPRGHNRSDRWCLTVLSGRLFFWKKPIDEWWTIEEYAAAMQIPPQMAVAVAKDMKPDDALMMLSKGVSPCASRWVGENVVLPMLTSGERSTGQAFIHEDDGAWTLDKNVRDRPKMEVPQTVQA